MENHETVMDKLSFSCDGGPAILRLITLNTAIKRSVEAINPVITKTVYIFRTAYNSYVGCLYR